MPEPPDRLPQFPIAGLMLLTGAIAIDLGLLRTCASYAPLGALLILLGLMLLHFYERFDAAVSLAVRFWAGIVLPMTLVAAAGMDRHNDVSNAGVWMVSLGILWIGPFATWSIVHHFRLPRTSAMLSGCLVLSGLYSFMAAFSFGFFGASGHEAALGKEPWPTAGAVIAITGIVASSIVAGIIHFRAMRSAWRRSYRNGLAVLLAIFGPIWLTAASEWIVVALLHMSGR